MIQKYVRLEKVGSPLAQAFGDNVRARRKALNLSQSELSEMVGVGAPHLSYIENGRANPTIEVMEALAIGLGCSLVDLLKTSE